jgi:methylase of polypeptide subunit release factors
MDRKDGALRNVALYLREHGYRFVTPTPLTATRIVNRPSPPKPTLRDIFGWNRTFDAHDLPLPVVEELAAADALDDRGGRLRARVRFSTLGGQLFVHSGFPTQAPNAVFFGPDTYRFIRTINEVLTSKDGPGIVIDLGAGSGAGGIHIARRFPNSHVILTDVNECALRYAAINASINDVQAEIRQSDVLNSIPEKADLIVCNPPYLLDPQRRLYRHGGGDWGCDLSVRMLRESLHHLTDNGIFLLYSGSAQIGGQDVLLGELLPVLKDYTTGFLYEEVDPDVFGEELETAPYSEADRIAVIRLLVRASDLRGNTHAP